MKQACADDRPDTPTCEAYRDFAVALAQSAARAILRAQRRGFEVDIKSDGSCVTDVDLQVERMLRRAIERRFPGHAVVGEEFPASGVSDFTWIIDPIDGTDNFVRGIPTFGTLIALYHRGRPLAAVLAHPALKRFYAAAAGQGVFVNGQPLRRVEPDPRMAPLVLTTAPENFEKSGVLDRFCAIQRQFGNTRIYRDCFAHSRVIEGAAAVMVDANARLWDIAATRVLVEASGSRFVETSRWRTPEGAEYHTCVFGRADLVEQLCALMAVPSSDGRE
ncbi:MAG: inositol monophosphatase family protein [Acidiferrobacteraceae bacterium]